MPIDFFDNPHKQTTSVGRFGLCDDVAPEDCPKTPAYIKESDEDNWTAEVVNPQQKTPTFYPIDNCIEILRPNGEMDNRCDGLLEYNGKLIFVELKDRAGGKWVGEGLKQLAVTIENFKKHHNIAEYTSIRAQLCNKQRPLAVVSCKTIVEKFKDDTGCIVSVDRNIII
ncbi:MAG: hypothetical protein K2M85_00055 [Paramuribaculum sp.]|nr:hypothetical protein [Paramuribaculum sp.]